MRHGTWVNFRAGRALAIAGAALGVMGTPARADTLANQAIVELQRNYRSQPVCERVSMQVRAASPNAASIPKVSRAAMVVRMDVEPRGIEDVPVVSVDLGTLVLTASLGQLVVTHGRDRNTYFEGAYSGPPSARSFAQVIQPVPVPQLDLAMAARSGATPCAEFWPYATNIRWGKVEMDGRAAMRKVVYGECDDGTVTLIINNNRLRALTIERNTPKTTFQFTFTPTGPCEPQRMLVDTTRRTRVATIAELKADGGTIRLGAKCPKMPISPPAGGEWSIAEILDPPPEAVIIGSPAADHAVLVMTRSTQQSGEIQALPRLDLSRLADLLRQMRSQSFEPRQRARLGEVEDPLARFGFARVLVVKDAEPDLVLAQMRAVQGKWQGHMLWSTSPGSTIDLFAPGADGAVVIVDSEQVLRAAWPIDPGQTAEQVADQVQAALFELAPVENKAK